MDFTISEELAVFKEQIRKSAEEKLKPIVLDLDRRRAYPRDFLKFIGKQGAMGCWMPEEYGGAGQGVLSLVLVAEEIARICAGTATAYSDIALGTLPILISGTEEQKQKYLPKIAAGECITSFALTEPESGSDAFAMKTKAVKNGEDYILNGEKQFITNAGECDICVVFVKTSQSDGPFGISGFILEKGMPGFEPSLKKCDKMGLHCSDTRNISLTDCKAPKEQLLGRKEGGGARALAKTLARSRIVAGGAHGVGIAQGAFELAWNYAREREQSGKKILDFQSIEHDFADMAVNISAARDLVYHAAWLVDSGAGEHDIAEYGAKAKIFAMKVAVDAASKCVEICGGAGYMRETGAEKFLRDAWGPRIYEGTEKILKNEIIRILRMKIKGKKQKRVKV